MTAPLLQTQVSDHEADQEYRLNEARLDLLTAFQVLLRTAQMHELGNETTQRQVERFRAAVEQYQQTVGEWPQIVFTEDSTFVNQRLAKVDATRYEAVHGLRAYLMERGIGEIVFEGIPERTDIHGFLAPFRESLRTPRDLSGARYGAWKFNPIRAAAGDSEATLSARQNVVRVYGKALILMREQYERAAEGKPPALNRMRRLIQELVDVSQNSEHLFLGIIRLKEYRNQLFNHSVNVGILSLLLGRLLNLGKAQLVELGVAAMLHDIGRAALPAELQMEQRPPTEAERALLEEVPQRGFALMMQTALGPAEMAAATTAWEYACDAAGRKRHFHDTPLVISRIVAIADAFDTLTTRTAAHEAYTPDEALRRMRQEAGTRFDRDLLDAFIELVGLYPVGTTVFLDGGEVAVVFNTHRKAALFRTPVVRILTDPSGRLRPGTIVDLAQQAARGERPSAIRGVVDFDVSGAAEPAAVQQVFFA